ncbi:hypothetical protein [Ohtaekwangia koreensis]|uniref:Uncharacterized protein n=1 Tax=Ohtaekwangia koreensis TaxID=688867 RepID=A0A1T5KHA8_9BACT|nr:hypothetical protein [Ohtaekwangia koreensis]SKC62805.1 hypothetical protein SAMN05660236_2169 [Ohtaekwangia koreensis]
MKRITILLSLLSMILACCHSGNSTSTTVSNGQESVKISDNDNTYTVEASFDEDKTMDVLQYIKEAVEPNSIFNPQDDRIDASATLSDGGIIDLKASGGELTLAFDKKANSREAYHRVKKLGEGVMKICDVR